MKRQAELELQTIQANSSIELILRDKRKIESEHETLRDKLKGVIKEKLELDNNLNMIQEHELTRLNELE